MTNAEKLFYELCQFLLTHAHSTVNVPTGTRYKDAIIRTNETLRSEPHYNLVPVVITSLTAKEDWCNAVTRYS